MLGVQCGLPASIYMMISGCHFYAQHVGQEAAVLFEDDVKNGIMEGFTPNYIRVAAKYDPLLVGELKRLRLLAVNPQGQMGAEEIGFEVLQH